MVKANCRILPFLRTENCFLAAPAISAVLKSYNRDHIDIITKMRIDQCCDHGIFLCLVFGLNLIDIKTPDKIMEEGGPTISWMSSAMTHKQTSVKPSVVKV